MAKILIEPSKAKSVLNLEDSLEKTLRTLSQEVDGIRSGLRSKIAGQEQISARLKDAVGQITKEAAAANAMRSGLEQVIAQYERTENGNIGRVAAEKTSVQQAGWNGGGALDTDDGHNRFVWDDLFLLDGGIFTRLLEKIVPPGPFTPFVQMIAEMILSDGKDEETDSPFLKARGDIDNKHEVEIDIKKAKKWKDGKKDIGDGKKVYYDFKTGKTIAVDSSNEEEFKEHNKDAVPVDVTLAGIGVAGSIAAFDQDFGDDWDWGGHEGNVSAAKLEGHVDGYLGWGAVGAEIGASFSAFTVEDKVYLGSEDTNVYLEGEVTVGKAEAKAGLDVGVVDKDGKFNPSLYAGASAEAIVGEVSGKAGVNIAGTDIGVKGSVNFGIGAHANVGLHDGKFSLDIGASVGIGASLKVDIDVSGTVDAIAEGVGEVWSGIKDFFHW